MATQTLEAGPGTDESVETSTEKAPESPGEERKTISDMDRLAVSDEHADSTQEPAEEKSTADSEDESAEDNNRKGTSEASEEAIKPTDKNAADILVEPSESASGAPDVALLVEAGSVGMSPETVANLAKAGSGALHSAIQDWKATMPSPESKKSQETAPALPKLDRGELGDDIVDAFEQMGAMLETLQSQNVKISSELSSVRDGHVQSDAANAETEFDKHVKGLSSDWEKIFGPGTKTSVSLKGTQAHVNRKQVFDQMRANDLIRQSLGQPALSREEAFQSALHGTFHRHATEIATQEISNSVVKRSKQSVQRPTAKDTEVTEEGTVKAIATASRLLKKMGLKG